MEKVDQKCVDPIECGFFEVWNFKTFWISSAKTSSVCFKDFLFFENQSMEKVDQKCVDPIECGFFEVWNLRPFGFLLLKPVQCVSKISGY